MRSKTSLLNKSKLSIENTYKYPGSNAFQRSVDAKNLCQFLIQKTNRTLDAEIQALLNEVTKQNDLRNYFYKGLMLCDDAVQTDPNQLEYQDMDDMARVLRDDYEILEHMTRIKQLEELKDKDLQEHRNSLVKIKDQEKDQSLHLYEIRKYCKDNLHDTIKQITDSYESHHQKTVNALEIDLKSKRSDHETKYSNILSSMQRTEDEYNRLCYYASEVHHILKKNEIPFDLKGYPSGANERIHTAQAISKYQKQIQEKDEEILDLRFQLSLLEGSNVSKFKKSSRVGSSNAKMRSSLSSNMALSPLSEAMSLFNEELSLEMEVGEEESVDFGPAEELKKEHEAQIDALQTQCDKEFEDLKNERCKIIHYGRMRLKSLKKVRKNENLKHLVLRQTNFLDLLTKSMKPKDKIEKGCTAFLAGNNLDLVLQKEKRDLEAARIVGISREPSFVDVPAEKPSILSLTLGMRPPSIQSDDASSDVVIEFMNASKDFVNPMKVHRSSSYLASHPLQTGKQSNTGPTLGAHLEANLGVPKNRPNRSSVNLTASKGSSANRSSVNLSAAKGSGTNRSSVNLNVLQRNAPRTGAKSAANSIENLNDSLQKKKSLGSLKKVVPKRQSQTISNRQNSCEAVSVNVNDESGSNIGIMYDFVGKMVQEPEPLFKARESVHETIQEISISSEHLIQDATIVRPWTAKQDE